jgi:hypothetical protein
MEQNGLCGMTPVTRNVSDLRGVKVKLLNPWAG